MTVTSDTSSLPAVIWQSKAPAVATVSPAGLVTAVAPGVAIVTATAGAATGQAQIIVQPAGTTTTTVTGCMSLLTPGRYVLGADLPATPPAPCITITNVASVQLDCAGHAVSGVFVRSANAVTISNCTTTDAASSSGYAAPLSMTSVNSVTVDECVVTSASPIGIQVMSGANVSFIQDAVTTSATGTAAAVVFTGGAHNRVISSTLTGGYTGGGSQSGADDGILITNETDDTIQGNTIRNFYDAGVEGVDAVSSTTVAGNTIDTIGTAAVASYWCTAWTNNTISGNSVSAAPTLFKAFYNVNVSLCGASRPAADSSARRSSAITSRTRSSARRVSPSARACSLISRQGP